MNKLSETVLSPRQTTQCAIAHLIIPQPVSNLSSAMDEPLNKYDARKLIRQIKTSGSVRFARHANECMSQRNITENDVRVALNGPVVSVDLIEGSWRYRVQGRNLIVVVAFRSETIVVVVTVWRS